jgi:hypothetical protein
VILHRILAPLLAPLAAVLLAAACSSEPEPVQPGQPEGGPESSSPDGARVCQRRTASKGPNGPYRGTNAMIPNGTSQWSETNEVLVADGKFASAPLSPGQITHELLVTGFEMQIPADADVVGIVVSIRRVGARAGVYDQSIRLARGRTRSISSKALADPWSTVSTTVEYGGQDDSWGERWTPDEINDPSFGVAIVARAGLVDAGGGDGGDAGLDGGSTVDAGSLAALVDHVGISVFYDICAF